MIKSANFCRISIHAPAGGATSPGVFRQINAPNFNSRPCGRGDEGGTAMADERTISIHAPAGGATVPCVPRQRGKHISIHAPAGGATYGIGTMIFLFLIFQFTPLREGRLVIFNINKTKFTFQFTPLREGRLTSLPSVSEPENFNSRPCGRGDPLPPPARIVHLDFNSRPCGRGDPSSAIFTLRSVLFQFTPLREGRPISFPPMPGPYRISIHAPAGGATRW